MRSYPPGVPLAADARVSESHTESHCTALTQCTETSGDYTAHEGFYEVAAAAPTTLLELEAAALAEAPGERVLAVAAGAAHTLVATHDNALDYTRVWALGSNEFGQLGPGAPLGAALNAVPVLIPAVGNFDPPWFGAAGVVAVAAGAHHSAVLDAHRRVWLFGRNSHGQLGFLCAAGTCSDACPGEEGSPCWAQRTPARLPAQVPVAPGINVSMALGEQHSLVLQQLPGANASSRLWTFGRNTYGQLGRTDSAVVGEARTAENETFIGVCAGAQHSMLLAADGRLWSAGRNRNGQLGSRYKDGAQHDDEPHAALAPVGTQLDGALDNRALKYEDPFGGDRVTHFACGLNHGVATSGRRGVTFGSNRFGQLMTEFNVGTGNPNPLPLAIDVSLLRETPDDPRPQPLLEAWAFGDVSLVRTRRVPCLVGHYSPDGLQPCLPCPAGNYSVVEGATSCTPCPPGNFSGEAATSCDPCPLGTFAAREGMAECERCPVDRPGTFGLASVSLEDDCTAFCQPGTFGPSLGTPPCHPCAAGSYSDAEAFVACEPCPIGSYQPENGSTACLPCVGLNSTAQTGAASPEACREVCSAGHEGPFGLEPCEQCAPGSAAPAPRSAPCAPCAQGSYQEQPGQQGCLACPAGQGTQDAGAASALECVDLCAPGEASPSGVVPCAPCGAGFIAPGNGTRECEACAAGSFSGPAQAACTPCDPGHFAAAQNSSQCEQCPLGSFQAASGQSACVLCPVATYADELGLLECKACSAGLNTKAPGTTSEAECAELCDPGYFSDDGLVPQNGACTACPAGTASVSLNPSGFGASVCTDCAPRSFSAGAASACSLCAPGSFSAESLASACTLCDPGEFSPGNATACEACAPGSFANDTGLGECFPCAPGSFEDDSGATVCGLCDVGTHAPLAGRATPCDDCQAGSYAPTEGLAECIPCAPGSSADGGAEACVPCDVGTYAGQQGAAECLLCPDGKFANVSGMAACLDCEAGTAAEPGSVECTGCSKGTYSPGSFATCAACGAGKDTRYARAESVAECRLVCKAGTFGVMGLGADGLGPCTYCAPGSEATETYAESCSECPAGHFARGGATDPVCLQCPAGTFSAANASVCTECSPGEFSADDGSSACDPCPAGQFNGDYGQDACALCPLGKFSTPARVECASCGTDTSTGRPGATTFDECQSYCPLGWFGPDNGVNKTDAPCRECAPGTYSPYTKLSECLPCPPGTFAAAAGAAACSPCPLHEFNEGEGAEACLACPPTDFGDATYTLVTGAALQTDCREWAGYACDTNPRDLALYPIYVGGDNDFGQALEGNVVAGPGGANIRQTVPPCSKFAGAEVYRAGLGDSHSVVQTAIATGVTATSVQFDTALWSFGLNRHGQLGSSRGLGTDQANPEPGLIPRFLFPSALAGNEISAAARNNLFQYRAWSDEADGNVLYNVTIPDGLYGPADVLAMVDEAAEAEFGHPRGVFGLALDPRTQQAVLPPPPPFRTKWTRRVPHPVLIGHAASLTPY